MCNIVSKDNNEVKFMNFFHKPGVVLVESSVSVINGVTDAVSCQVQCLCHESCLSVNFGKSTNQTTFVCELNNSTSLAKPLKMRRRQGFEFYGLAVSITRRVMLLQSAINWIN